jgi:hypothetical protein
MAGRLLDILSEERRKKHPSLTLRVGHERLNDSSN